MASIKNQIKAYTATAIKNDVINYFMFLGGICGSSNSIVDETDISLISRITKDEVAVVIPRVDWVTNSEYNPLVLGITNDSDSYVYNSTNGIVYLCVGKNYPNGLIGDQSYKSTILPSHIVGTAILDDGYMWQALYKIDTIIEKFVNSKVIPVPSLYDYRQDNLSGSYATKYDSLCTSKGITGSCYFYYNEQTLDSSTGITYQVGDRVLGFPETNWYCSVCHETGEKFGYKSYHVDYVNKESKINRNPLQDILTDFSKGYLNVNSNDFVQQGNYKYISELNHGIISLQLDVSNLTIEQRIVNTQNPDVTILDARGYGAIAKIKTYYDILRNAFVANGIELQSSGQDFVNPQFIINDAVDTKLQKAIKAVILDPPYLIDPSIILSTPRISIVKKITNDELVNVYDTDQRIFTRVGIVENILTEDGTNLSTGLIAGEKVEKRTTSKILISSVSPEPLFMLFTSASTPNIKIGNIFVSELADTNINITETGVSDKDYNSKLVAIIDNGDDTFNLEIAGGDELTFNVLTSAQTITIDDTQYQIEDYIKPTTKVDLVNYVATRTLDVPINMSEPTSKMNSITLNFLL